MKKKQKNTLIIGLLLIAAGILFIAFQFIPGLRRSLEGLISWPVIIIGFGIFLLIKNLLDKDEEGLVAACVITGVGGILYWQEMFGAWGDWYYWLLVPGFAGAGHILSSLFNSSGQSLQKGLWQIGLSAVLFLIFSPFLRLSWLFDQYWPVLLIAAGVIMIVKALIKK